MPIDDVLFQRLRSAQRPDLISLISDLKLDANKFQGKPDDELVDAISAELRSVAGNSLMNPTRGPHDFLYKELLVDVADKLAPGLTSWSHFRVSGPESEVEIEDYIAERVEVRVAELVSAMNEEDRRKLQARLELDMQSKGIPESVTRAAVTGLSTGAISGIAFGPLIASLLYSGLWTSIFGLTTAQVLLGGVALGGPVGIGLAAIAVLSGPSYSKTIPAVYRLILIRRSAEAREAMRGQS
ncbi:MAG: hypothetical protein ABJA94_11240 [Rhodoglobus sp.]